MSDKIEDNSSYKKLKQQFEGVDALRNILDFFPIPGLDPIEFEKALEPFVDLKKEFEIISKAPDRFNHHFAKRGWIAHESMNESLLFSCIELAEKGQIAEAEQKLIEYYSSDKMKWLKHQFKGLEVFRKRFSLINLAYDDTIAERYHACIPVLLMIIDGGVNDIDKITGFFAERTDVTAWDSIAAHSTGLATLKDIFNDTRAKTTEEVITMPYRHGILHGRDINYANKTVAAKCWAALFAVSDWARAVRDGKKVAPEPAPELTVEETLAQLHDSVKKYEQQKERRTFEQKLLELWKARIITIGLDIPEKGHHTDYKDYTPEQEAVRFIEYWSSNNYGAIAKQIHQFSKYNFKLSSEAGKVRKVFENKIILDYKIVQVKDTSASISEVILEVSFEHNDEQYAREITLRLIYQDKDGGMLINGETGGQWRFVENFFHVVGYSY
ncbi:hypothetical protein [Sphingobacterium faecale]|uniref:Uncharacterized protein n=1 Tax=Sphingobacterium faecale TaxID=2803775 RepID=A0ABS1R9X0_9SPHI|nr:hypothetical protein [Sphingobacterium faecale]MBL1411507.1 hypothetical protein [Sphingobacterium faecale]